MTSKRHAHFAVFLTPDGYHESGWRVQEHDPVESASVNSFFRSAALAERGLLDGVFIADAPALTVFRASFFPQVRYDPITLLTALGMTSRRIGLIGTATTTYNTPYELARRLATADHITGGRIGWNVVTTHNRDAALNFGLDAHPGHDDRYARASEFVEVVRRLWDSWSEDAIVGDRSAGVWADTSRMHPADFHGEYYDVAGALPVPRPPQGHPVLAQAGSSPAGIELAGQVADVVFTPQRDVEAGLAFREKIDAAAARHGRSAGNVRILPGLAFVLGSTDAEAAQRRRALEESVDPELRWRNLAHNAGLDHELIDPAKPLSEEVAATAEKITFAQVIVGQALESQRPFGELAQTITGLPGGLEFTGTPERLADLVEEWVTRGGSDGFTLQPTTLPQSLELFVDHVVPILQRRGLHRREYAGTTLRDHLGLARPEPSEEARPSSGDTVKPDNAANPASGRTGESNTGRRLVVFCQVETTIDSMGRIVVPKPLRDALGLTPGSRVDVSRYGAGLQLVPTGRTARLVDESGVLVATGDTAIDDDDLFGLIDAGRR